MRRSCDVVLVALARKVALKLPSSSFLREDVFWFQVELFLLGGFVLIAFRLLVALSASGELSVDFSLDGCFEIDQLLEVVIIGGVSNQVIGQLFAVFVFLKAKKQSVPLCCILLCELFIGEGPLEVTLKIIVILSVKRQLQKLPPEETTLAVVFLKKVSQQFDVMDDIEVVVLFLLLLVLDSLEAELDCLFVVAAFLLKGLLEVVKWAFFGRSFGLGLRLGLGRRSCDFFESFSELLKISQCSLIGGRLLNQDTCAEGLNNLLRLAGFGHGCLFDCRDNFFGWFFDLKMRYG